MKSNTKTILTILWAEKGVEDPGITCPWSTFAGAHWAWVSASSPVNSTLRTLIWAFSLWAPMAGLHLQLLPKPKALLSVSPTGWISIKQTERYISATAAHATKGGMLNGLESGQVHVNYISMGHWAHEEGWSLLGPLSNRALGTQHYDQPKQVIQRRLGIFSCKIPFLSFLFLGLTREKHTLTNVQEFCGCDNQWR